MNRVRVTWRRFLARAVAQQGGTIVRTAGLYGLRDAFAQSLDHIDAYREYGGVKQLKGKLKEVIRRTLSIWDGALPWNPDHEGPTLVDRRVEKSLVNTGGG